MTAIDFRPGEQIRAGLHAVAHLRSTDRIVRGIDRFTHLPTREPAAMVWVADWTGLGHHLELVALDDITICPGAQS